MPLSHLAGGRGGRVGSFAVGGKVAVGIGLVLAAGLIVLPWASDGVSDQPLLLFLVPIGLCAVRFGVRGGLGAAAVGVAIAALWWQGEHFAGGPLDFGILAAVFLLVGVVVGSVVSERKRYERAIITHNEISLDLICTASYDGYFTRLNPAWKTVMGYELDELLARPYMDFVHPDDLEGTAVEVVRQTDAGRPVHNFQNRYRCANGSYRWLEWNSRPDPSTRMMYAVARDITERKQAEEAVADFQAMLEHAVQERTAELQERSRELDESRREMLRRLALAAEYRDDETFEHTERVGRMAAQLARRLQISADNAALLRWAAPLHDIGKLGLSDTIVLKTGTLTSEEMNQVRKHPLDGARILANSNSDVLQLAEQIALNHHEWWDGSGYPSGLSGEAIPQCARIVAVADVYDALTHVRPYKGAWPHEQAVDQIRQLRGRQFDPQVVDAFLELYADEPVAQTTSTAIFAASE